MRVYDPLSLSLAPWLHSGRFCVLKGFIATLPAWHGRGGGEGGGEVKKGDWLNGARAGSFVAAPLLNLAGSVVGGGGRGGLAMSCLPLPM